MPLFQRAVILSLLAIALLAVNSVAAPMVLFDEAHGQNFLIGNEGALDLSGLASLYRDNGFTVASRSQALTAADLSAVDVLVMSGAFAPLTRGELETVIEFVEAGGGLAVMLHIAPPMRALLYRLQIDFANGILHESNQLIDGNPLNFRVKTLAKHPVTKGLQGFSVYGAWALRGIGPQSMVLAETGPQGWVDLNNDNQLTKVDAVQSFGVMVAGEMGKGRYVVLGDDAVFQNRFLDADNRQLALGLVNWLARR